MEVLAQDLNKDIFRSPSNEQAVFGVVEPIPCHPDPFGLCAAAIAREGKVVP